jgi:hypothetical protein
VVNKAIKFDELMKVDEVDKTNEVDEACVDIDAN